MRDDLIRLKLVLDELDLGSTISSFSERLMIQKGVLLAQFAGVNLGYRFNWYVSGPYSPDLADDYYDLDKLIKTGDANFNNYRLKEGIKEKLGPIKSVIRNCPDDMEEYRWFELLASIVYQYNQLYSVDKVKEILCEKKKHLLPHLDIGIDALESNGIIKTSS